MKEICREFFLWQQLVIVRKYITSLVPDLLHFGTARSQMTLGNHGTNGFNHYLLLLDIQSSHKKNLGHWLKSTDVWIFFIKPLSIFFSLALLWVSNCFKKTQAIKKRYTCLLSKHYKLFWADNLLKKLKIGLTQRIFILHLLSEFLYWNFDWFLSHFLPFLNRQ